ncbi:biopolymer transporter ExbD [soil metagenome]
MARRNKSNAPQEINASSMADIAFLLLIFFLVTTTIDYDKGILHKLPPITDAPPPDVKSNKRNTMVVLINQQDYLLVNNEHTSIKVLRKRAKEFLNNNGRNPNWSINPKEAIISLQNDRGTSYGLYLRVQNELKAAYRELRDEYALRKYGNKFEELKAIAKDSGREADKAKVEDVADQFPMRLSEAEPKEIGG